MKLFKFSALCLSALLLFGTQAVDAKKMTPWKKGAAVTGKYRNYFKELGYKQADIDAKIANAYYQVFESPTRAYFDVQVDGGAAQRVEAPATTGCRGTVKLGVRLTAGVHAVRVSNEFAWAPDLDRMTIHATAR